MRFIIVRRYLLSQYLASVLTHEVFILIPPVFISIYALAIRKKSERTAEGKIVPFHRIGHLTPYLLIIISYALWRTVILPMYEADYFVGLPNYSMILNPVTLVKKVVLGADIIFIPWDRALGQILLFRPSLWSVLLCMMVSVGVWVLTLHLFSQSPSSLAGSVNLNRNQQTVRHWLSAASCGLLLVLAGLIIVGISAANNIETINAMRSRVNFVGLIGVSLLLPTLPILLIQRYRVFKAYKVCVVFCLVCIGLVHILIQWSNFSVAAFFHRYSLRFALVAVICVAGAAVCLTLVIRSFRNRTRDLDAAKHPVLVHQFLAGTVASLVFFGSLFHCSVKYEWATAWGQYNSMLTKLRTIAPAFKDDTFVIILGPANSEVFRLIRWRVVTGAELSAHLLVFYENWSIMGYLSERGDYPGLVFFSDGIEVSKEDAWFPPGVKGPLITSATAAIPRIPYNRLVLFEFRDHSIYLLSEMEVETVIGERLLVRNNPERILFRKPLTTATWNHIR